MTRAVFYNYRTNNNGDQFWDSYFVGEQYTILDKTVIVECIEEQPDGSAVIHVYTADEKGNPTKTYLITQTRIHSVIVELE